MAGRQAAHFHGAHRNASFVSFGFLPLAIAPYENGASVHQLMALIGWKTEKMALVYTRKADRKRLASTAAPLLLLPTQTQNENRPHLGSGAGDYENSD